MSNDESISEFLHSNFGLGQESKQNQTFNTESLAIPFNTDKHGKLHPNIKYKNPTPYDFGHFKEVTGQSTGAICKFLGMDSRDLSHFISQKSFERGNSIPSSMWGQLTEASDLTERLNLKARYIDVSDEVLLTSQSKPTKHELFLLISISKLTIEEVSELSGIELELLQNNSTKGSTAYDRKMNNLTPSLENSLTKIHTSETDLTIEQWLKIRKALNIKGIGFIKKPPQIRAACFSTDLSLYMPSPYAKTRKEVMNSEEFKKQSLRFENSTSLAEYSNDTTEPHFITDNSEPYSPPTPKELRQIIYWTGYTFGELSTLLGIKPKELGFLTSKNAYNHVTYRDKRSGKVTNKHNPNAKPSPPSTRYIPYYMWRRLVETFDLTAQRKITTNKN